MKTVMCQKLSKLMIDLNRLSEAEEFNSQAEAVPRATNAPDTI